MQEIQFLEFSMGGSNVPQGFPNYLICLCFIRISTVLLDAIHFQTCTSGALAVPQTSHKRSHSNDSFCSWVHGCIISMNDFIYHNMLIVFAATSLGPVRLPLSNFILPPLLFCVTAQLSQFRHCLTKLFWIL